MLVYEGIKSEFINDVNLNSIVNKIYDRYKKFFGKCWNSSAYRSAKKDVW